MQYEKTIVKVYKIPNGQAQPNPPNDDYLGEVETHDGNWTKSVNLQIAGEFRLYAMPTDRNGNAGAVSNIVTITVNP